MERGQDVLNASLAHSLKVQEIEDSESLLVF